ncbi:MAG: hypothetical protein ACYTFA_14530 [Planctomycetota bacterium]|jgi:hypothetical protein
MKKTRIFQIVTLLATGTILLSGCPSSGLVGGVISDCFDEDSISASEYDDLNVFEQLLYEENDCGRYEPISSALDDVLD